MASRFAATMLAGLVLLPVALGARQSGSPGATSVILSVVVEVGPSSVRVLSATAVRGVIRPVDQQALSKAPHSSDQALIEYTASSKTAPGAATFTSVFQVSFTPIVEERPAQAAATKVPPSTVPKTGQPVTIAIALPDLPADAIISFSRLTPQPGVPPGNWQRTPMGQSSLPPVRR